MTHQDIQSENRNGQKLQQRSVIEGGVCESVWRLVELSDYERENVINHDKSTRMEEQPLPQRRQWRQQQLSIVFPPILSRLFAKREAKLAGTAEGDKLLQPHQQNTLFSWNGGDVSSISAPIPQCPSLTQLASVPPTSATASAASSTEKNDSRESKNGQRDVNNSKVAAAAFDGNLQTPQMTQNFDWSVLLGLVRSFLKKEEKEDDASSNDRRGRLQQASGVVDRQPGNATSSSSNICYDEERAGENGDDGPQNKPSNGHLKGESSGAKTNFIQFRRRLRQQQQQGSLLTWLLTGKGHLTGTSAATATTTARISSNRLLPVHRTSDESVTFNHHQAVTVTHATPTVLRNVVFLAVPPTVTDADRMALTQFLFNCLQRRNTTKSDERDVVDQSEDDDVIGWDGAAHVALLPEDACSALVFGHRPSSSSHLGSHSYSRTFRSVIPSPLNSDATQNSTKKQQTSTPTSTSTSTQQRVVFVRNQVSADADGGGGHTIVVSIHYDSEAMVAYLEEVESKKCEKEDASAAMKVEDAKGKRAAEAVMHEYGAHSGSNDGGLGRGCWLSGTVRVSLVSRCRVRQFYQSEFGYYDDRLISHRSGDSASDQSHRRWNEDSAGDHHHSGPSHTAFVLLRQLTRNFGLSHWSAVPNDKANKNNNTNTKDILKDLRYLIINTSEENEEVDDDDDEVQIDETRNPVPSTSSSLAGTTQHIQNTVIPFPPVVIAGNGARRGTVEALKEHLTAFVLSKMNGTATGVSSTDVDRSSSSLVRGAVRQHWDRTLVFVSSTHSRLAPILGLNLLMKATQRSSFRGAAGAGGETRKRNRQTTNNKNMEENMLSEDLARGQGGGNGGAFANGDGIRGGDAEQLSSEVTSFTVGLSRQEYIELGASAILSHCP